VLLFAASTPSCLPGRGFAARTAAPVIAHVQPVHLVADGNPGLLEVRHAKSRTTA